MSRKGLVLAVLAGIGLGLASSAWSYRVALANIRVRPELAKVDWLDALLSGHFNDWLFYHYPLAGIVICVIFCIVFTLGVYARLR